jgi:hypothetical protein
MKLFVFVIINGFMRRNGRIDSVFIDASGFCLFAVILFGAMSVTNSSLLGAKHHVAFCFAPYVIQTPARYVTEAASCRFLFCSVRDTNSSKILTVST